MQAARTWRLALLIAWLLALAGCAGVRLVGDYDEQIDKGVSALQRETEIFFVRLESVPGPMAAPYEPNKAFYGEVRVAVSSLRLRADATERNSLTVRMLDLLQTNYNRLEGDHREGIGKLELPLYLGALNSQFTSILTFELAKKRGEKPDESKAAAPPTRSTVAPGAKP
jgi:hypothetical protein